ncbi:MAG: AhpC/TSA family protein [Bryobacterales bacterium]|nr:AhpC/TSA family protein [Bryobacterales bacterium]
MHLYRTSILWAALLAAPVLAAPPSVGQPAPDFTLSSVQGAPVRLSELTAQSPVALIVLRGFPGYQCPLCQRQVQDFLKHASAFTDAGVQLVFIYPGPRDTIDAKARQFLEDKPLPPGVHMLLDPGYEFTALYGLRWDAPRETAFPSTFLIDKGGRVYFQKVAMLHGGRTTAAEIIALLPRRKP